jgi:hypothetical protein
MKIKDFFQDFDINPISSSLLHGPVTTTTLMHLQECNEAKRQQAIERLGSKWLIHPDNRAQRKDMQ